MAKAMAISIADPLLLNSLPEALQLTTTFGAVIKMRNKAGLKYYLGRNLKGYELTFLGENN